MEMYKETLNYVMNNSWAFIFQALRVSVEKY